MLFIRHHLGILLEKGALKDKALMGTGYGLNEIRKDWRHEWVRGDFIKNGDMCGQRTRAYGRLLVSSDRLEEHSYLLEQSVPPRDGESTIRKTWILSDECCSTAT